MKDIIDCSFGQGIQRVNQGKMIRINGLYINNRSTEYYRVKGGAFGVAGLMNIPVKNPTGETQRRKAAQANVKITSTTARRVYENAVGYPST